LGPNASAKLRSQVALEGKTRGFRRATRLQHASRCPSRCSAELLRALINCSVARPSGNLLKGEKMSDGIGKSITDIVQTVAILSTLGFSIWQWRKTNETIKVDNFAKLISALNDIRRERLLSPDLERALFESRKEWDDTKIKKRVYGVMFANLLEWSMFSHESGLIDEKQWKDWITIWKDVILSDKSFAELMCDKTIYTFNLRAYELVKSLLSK
jgi:hypothetical protein